MSNRLTIITTRTGDDGKTSLGGGDRIAKSHEKIEALGTLDECNSAIGVVLAHSPPDLTISDILKQIQQDLFDVGGELCPPFTVAVTPEKILFLETAIQTWNETLPPLKEFILPGGNLQSASCHVARTVCRRAERCLVALYEKEPVNLDILRYINRLSDLLFIIARVLARETNDTEEMWERS